MFQNFPFFLFTRKFQLLKTGTSPLKSNLKGQVNTESSGFSITSPAESTIRMREVSHQNLNFGDSLIKSSMMIPYDAIQGEGQ